MRDVSGAWYRLPARLRPIPEQRARTLRLIWSALFAFALVVVVVATAYTIRATYSYQPLFTSFGMDFEVEDGTLLVGPLPARPGAEAPPINAHVVAINGERLPSDATLGMVSDRLKRSGTRAEITVVGPSGELRTLNQERRGLTASSEALRDRDYRVVARLVMALLACSFLLLCSFLLALRRPEDPVAMLFAFIFAIMAATVDPPVQFWLWTGYGWVEEWLSSSWFYLLLVGLAVFPDGVFVPRWLRWIWIGALPLVVYAGLPDINPAIQMIIPAAALLALLIGQVVRYRRLHSGIERQQIKWAGFGFASGFILLAVAFFMVSLIPQDSTQRDPLFNLATLVLFSLAIAMIPLGLLIALTRFRLWEADTVITRSAAYAVVTLIVGVVWAASSDLVKLVITEVMGHESEAGATTVGAIIAAGIFSPTQSAVLGWTRRRFGGPMDRIEGAAQRLKSWGLTETPEEVATRALGIIEEAIHPAQAAVVLDMPLGPQMVAARNVSAPDDRRLIETLSLADEEGPVGTLRLGRRSDGNRYNRQELEALRQIIPHLADALRVARGRHSRESVLQQQIEQMAARLAQLEGSSPKPA